MKLSRSSSGTVSGYFGWLIVFSVKIWIPSSRWSIVEYFGNVRFLCFSELEKTVFTYCSVLNWRFKNRLWYCTCIFLFVRLCIAAIMWRHCPFLFALDVSQPSVAVKRLPSPGAPFVPASLFLLSSPSALEWVSASFCRLVSASQSCGVVAPLPFVLDVSRPSVAVKHSPSPGAPFVPASLFVSVLPSALDHLWLLSPILPSLGGPQEKCHFFK